MAENELIAIDDDTEDRGDGARGLSDFSRPPSQQSDPIQFRILKSWVMGDLDASSWWRENECKTSFAFRAGHQWTEEDKTILADQNRPVIVFNRVLTILKAVAGMEINGRHEATFIPRGTEDTATNELLTQAVQWMTDQCDAEDEESAAFDDSSTCGMGWVEERMSYLEDPKGKYLTEKLPPSEMVWDRRAKKKNVSDANRLARIRRMPLSDAMRMFKGKTRDQIDATWATDGQLDEATRTLEQRRRRTADNSESPDDLWHDNVEVTVVHIQWREIETYHVVADEQTGEMVEVTAQELETLKRRFAMLSEKLGQELTLQTATLERYVYKQAFLGNEMLRPARPCPLGDQFSWKCVTGERDDEKNCWFGLVRVLRDPQMWANKWLSQILHILNTSAKGGILAELDAFEDPRDAEESYAKAESITWLKEGALSGGKKPKIMPKPTQSATDSFVGLLTFAISSFKDVTGINLELLGQQDQNQPGILEAMRKQAGMTVLATMFDSLRKFRKSLGRGRLYCIQRYMSDGRFIRITNPEDNSMTAVPLLKDRTTGEYDVVIADTPTSPNQKEANWAIIQPMLVVFKDQLMAQPEVLAILLEYSPLPARIVETLKKFIAEAKNNPEQQRKAKMQEELFVAAETAKIRKDESVAALNQAKAGGEQMSAAYLLAQARNMIEDNKFNEAKNLLSMMEAQAKAAEADNNRLMAEAKAERERVGTITDVQDAHVRRAEAETKAKTDSVGMVIEAMTATAKAEKDRADAAAKRVGAVKDARTPIADPNRTKANAL